MAEAKEFYGKYWSVPPESAERISTRRSVREADLTSKRRKEKDYSL